MEENKKRSSTKIYTDTKSSVVPLFGIVALASFILCQVLFSNKIFNVSIIEPQTTIELTKEELAEIKADFTPLPGYRAAETEDVVHARNNERIISKRSGRKEIGAERQRQIKAQKEIIAKKAALKRKLDLIEKKEREMEQAREREKSRERERIKRRDIQRAKTKQKQKQKQRKKENHKKTKCKTCSATNFKTQIHTNEPCQMKGPAQINCLRKKYEYCLSKKEEFCSLYDLNNAIAKVKKDYEIPVGTKVQAKWSPNGEYIPGKIFKINTDGTYDVKFDNENLQVKRRRYTPHDNIKRDDSREDSPGKYQSKAKDDLFKFQFRF